MNTFVISGDSLLTHCEKMVDSFSSPRSILFLQRRRRAREKPPVTGFSTVRLRAAPGQTKPQPRLSPAATRVPRHTCPPPAFLHRLPGSLSSTQRRRGERARDISVTSIHLAQGSKRRRGTYAAYAAACGHARASLNSPRGEGACNAATSAKARKKGCFLRLQSTTSNLLTKYSRQEKKKKKTRFVKAE